jgi:hypothetical protein
VFIRRTRKCREAHWKLAFDTARPALEIDKESVKRNRLVQLAGRSMVLLSHER